MINDLKSLREIWNKLMYVLLPVHKRMGIGVFVLSIFASIAELLGVAVILPLVQLFVEPEKLSNYSIINRLSFYLGIKTRNGLMILVVLMVIMVYVLKNAFLFAVVWIREKYSMKINREISLRMVKSYVRRGYNYFRLNNLSDFSRGASGSVTGVNCVISHFFRLLSEILTIFCVLIFVFITDYKMSIMMCLVAVVCVLLITKLFRRKVAEAGRIVYRESAVAGMWLNQLYYGIKEVLVMNRKDFFIGNYENGYIRMQRAQIKQTMANDLPVYMIETVCVIGIMIGVVIRVIGMDNPAEYVPQLSAFAMAAFRIMPSMGRITAYVNGIIFYVPYVNNTYQNMLEANTLDEKIKEKGFETDGEEIDHHFEKELKVRSVSYRYLDGTTDVLDNLSITINKGQSVGLVGPSGAGKSTLADVILGLFEPQSGNVEVDGIDILLHKKMWSKMIGFVPQAPYLIDDTVRRNIAFGIYDHEIDDDKIWRALEQAQMKSFIEEQPQGLDTMVGDRGVRFSGGQAQRLVIARALYNDPDILIFDEATSALDNETEKAVMESIDALQRHKTMIIIAHRLTTIKNCDVIYEIKDGKATVKKYEELLKGVGM